MRRVAALLALLTLAACAGEPESVANRFDRTNAEIENKARQLDAEVENQVRDVERDTQNQIDAIIDRQNAAAPAGTNAAIANSAL